MNQEKNLFCLFSSLILHPSSLHPMNRRSFLDPRRLARAAGEVLGVLDELQGLGSESGPTGDSALLHFSRRAMATTFEVIVPFGTPHALVAADDALDEIDRLEAQLTVFREESEVSQLNRRAAFEAVRVEDRLFDLLALAARLNRETEEAFDISVGALTKAWGFYKRTGRVPSEEERAEVKNRIGMRHVLLEPEMKTVRYLRPGLEINLGSIGKGYALDRAGERLRLEWGLSHILLHGGQSSVLALGSAPGRANGWPIALRHPWDDERMLGVVRLRDAALGTSAANYQHLDYNGRKLGHILDPRSGWPAESVASATAIAPTGAEADALATAFFILGVDKARAYCAAHPGIGAVLLPQGDDAEPVAFGITLENTAPRS
jgi:thiamine biosynthesis lipoprotein